MDEKIEALILHYAETNGVSFSGACVLISREIESYFTNSTRSGSRTISAADSAISAINRHFEEEIHNRDWGNLAVLQKAALSAALASVISAS